MKTKKKDSNNPIYIKVYAKEHQMNISKTFIFRDRNTIFSGIYQESESTLF